ncbi:hypothetical protein EMCRGX_G027126 [Ephydatia muelleri]|eukprot:Em0014g178a
MPANVEIKAKLRNREEVLETAKKLSGGNGTVLVQEDTFFNCPNGRLKLRMQTGCPGQLIFYSREDIAGPKLSQYRISKVKDVDDMKTTLEQALGIMGFAMEATSSQCFQGHSSLTRCDSSSLNVFW